MTKNEINALLTTIGETPEGAPEGPMYAAMMSAGWTLNDWQTAIEFCRSQGLIRGDNHVLYPTEKLTEILGRLKQAA